MSHSHSLPLQLTDSKHIKPAKEAGYPLGLESVAIRGGMTGSIWNVPLHASPLLASSVSHSFKWYFCTNKTYADMKIICIQAIPLLYVKTLDNPAYPCTDPSSFDSLNQIYVRRVGSASIILATSVRNDISTFVPSFAFTSINIIPLSSAKSFAVL